MTCQCGTMICYCCRAVIKGYDHFTQTPSGAPNTKHVLPEKGCPLFDNTADRNQNDVKAAAEIAAKETEKEIPSIDAERLRESVQQLETAGKSNQGRQQAQPPVPGRQHVQPQPPIQQVRPPPYGRQQVRPPAQVRQQVQPPAQGRQQVRPPVQGRQQGRPPAAPNVWPMDRVQDILDDRFEAALQAAANHAEQVYQGARNNPIMIGGITRNNPIVIGNNAPHNPIVIGGNFHNAPNNPIVIDQPRVAGAATHPPRPAAFNPPRPPIAAIPAQPPRQNHRPQNGGDAKRQRRQ